MGLSGSPTSGSVSNSSDNSHSRKLEYSRGRRIEHVDYTATAHVLAHQVVEVQRRFAEEGVAAILLQPQQGALDGADRRRADQSVGLGDQLALLGDMIEQGAQVGQVQQQHSLVVSQLEGDVEYAGLGVIEFEDTRQQRRPDLGNRGAHRMPEPGVQIPEHHRVGFRLPVGDADVLQALVDLRVRAARLAQTGDVALHVSHEYRDADAREAFGHHHQADGLAGTGCSSHQPMTIAVLGQQFDGIFAFSEKNRVVAHGYLVFRTGPAF